MRSTINTFHLREPRGCAPASPCRGRRPSRRRPGHVHRPMLRRAPCGRRCCTSPRKRQRGAVCGWPGRKPSAPSPNCGASPPEAVHSEAARLAEASFTVGCVRGKLCLDACRGEARGRRESQSTGTSPENGRSRLRFRRRSMLLACTRIDSMRRVPRR